MGYSRQNSRVTDNVVVKIRHLASWSSESCGAILTRRCQSTLSCGLLGTLPCHCGTMTLSIRGICIQIHSSSARLGRGKEKLDTIVSLTCIGTKEEKSHTNGAR